MSLRRRIAVGGTALLAGAFGVAAPAVRADDGGEVPSSEDDGPDLSGQGVDPGGSGVSSQDESSAAGDQVDDGTDRPPEAGDTDTPDASGGQSTTPPATPPSAPPADAAAPPTPAPAAPAPAAPQAPSSTVPPPPASGLKWQQQDAGASSARTHEQTLGAGVVSHRRDAAPAPSPAARPAAPAPRAEPVAASAPEQAPRGGTYVVRSGDSLWSIASRRLGPGASYARVAREVNRLWELNADRIASGSPDVLNVGDELRVD